MMKFEQVVESLRKVGEYFQSRPPLDKVVVGGVFLFVVLAVLSRADVVFIFIAAVFLGGWAAARVAGHVRVFRSRHLLPFLPNLVDRVKEKRKHAGLSVLPNFEADLDRHSINCSIKSKNFAKNYAHLRNMCRLDQLSLPGTVDEEFQHLIKSVMHDFVLSWYSVYVSDHSQVSEELLNVLMNTFANLSSRVKFISKRSLLTNFLVEIRTHVYRFQRARSSLRKLRSGRTIDSNSLVASYETFCLMHPAIEDADTEMNYLKSVMRVLLHSAVTEDVNQCQASTAVLVEILTCNLLLPLLDLLADPDFLYRLIHLIVSSIVSAPEKIGTLESEGADSSKPKKPSPSEKGDLHPKGISNVSCPYDPESDQSSASCLPKGSLQMTNLSQGSDKQHSSPTPPKSAILSDVFEPRSDSEPTFKPDTDRKGPFQLESRNPNVVHRANQEAVSSLSRVPISRSVDALVIHSQSAVSHGQQSAETSPACSSLFVQSHRRTASDSSFHPAHGGFIPGDAIPSIKGPCPSPRDIIPAAVPSANPSIPRPPTEGSENTSTCYQVAVPLTAIEPAIAVTPLMRTDSNDVRPRSSSSESFSSIDYDTSQLNTPFSVIDNQFALEGSSRSAIPTTNVLNSGILSESQMMKQSKSTSEIDGGIAMRSVENHEDSNSSPRQIFPSGDIPNSDDAYYASGPTTDAEIQNLSPAHGTVSLVGPQVTPPAINVTDSSPIKKLLRRVSFSKKNHPESQKCQMTQTENVSLPANQQSAPIAIPVPVQKTTPVSSSIQQSRSPPLLPQLRPVISVSDKMQTPSAENPRMMSVSAPEMSDLEPPMGFTEGLLPMKIINLEIPKAEVCKEVGGKGEFFVYSIQFDVLQTTSPSSSTENLDRCDVSPIRKTAKRRHREFVNLHSRLEHNPQLKLSLKGIRDVPKRLSIPLAPTAKSAIDQRRVGHQRYLQQLLARPLLHCSSELSEFLALEGNTNIEYVRYHPREYVPRIDKMLRNRVSGLVDTIKQVKSAIPRALSDLGPLPPMSPPMSPIRKARGPQEAGKRLLSPPGSPRPGSPSIDEPDGSSGERIFTFDRRPKTTLQLAMCSIIQDHSLKTFANSPLPAYPATATGPIVDHLLGPRSEGDGCESPDASVVETQLEGKESSAVLGMEEVALFDSVLCLLGEAFHDKELWFLDEGFQNVLTILAGDLLDGWLERQVDVLLSEHWCAFFLAELREVLWPGGKLLSASEGAGTRTETEKAATIKEVLTMLVESMPESFYKVIDRQDWQDGLQLLLDSLGDPQLNRHLMFTALDLLMDALISEIKDEGFQKDLLTRI
ncbi:uncharacterized protein LOC119724958 [Patiria miniata]|uniref:Sorting nexin-19 n=1 Tax=Patiria miniata TaxID=46514 RepID=A0A913ZM93_PATMI|nr:uncharacterized protein LOC119724958 [Patiria miniata]